MFLITGSNGQLGTELTKLLPLAIATDAAALDITDTNAVSAFVKGNDIDTIINCAAYTAVDKAEEENELAFKVNVSGVENLAKTGAKIIHISTDYVFDGTAHRPYTPDDKPVPVSVYGRTKLEGEKAVLENADIAIIIRTAWLYSPYGNNFVKTMQRLGKERDSINVVCDQIGTPTYAADLAAAIVAILPQMSKDSRGIYHYTNEGVCSWYDFTLAIHELAGITKCQVRPILSEEYQYKTPRPHYSVLDKSKFKKTFDVTIPHWMDGLRRCMRI